MARHRFIGCLAAYVALLFGRPGDVHAYIGGPPGTLGMMCYWSTHVMVVQVERVDKEKKVIVFRKVQDCKGKWPADVIIHSIGAGAQDRQHIMEWAQVGKKTVTFALESYKWSHTYVDRQWYASNTGDWRAWTMSHGEPMLLRYYSGKPERLVIAATAILAGKEVVVPCMVDTNLQDLALRRARVRRLRAGLKRLDFNANRDFVGWGGDDFMPIGSMPGFTHIAFLPRVDADAQTISSIDIDGDGKPDLCLAGGGQIALLKNDGIGFSQDVMGLPRAAPVPAGAKDDWCGCRAAVWADYNGDGKPDLLLATPSGPKLFTNLGGSFRDDSALLPREPYYDLTAAAWIDYDGDGKPDLLLGNGFHGLRLYRNKGKADAPPARPGKPAVAATWFEDVSVKVGFGPDGIGANSKGDTLTVADVDGDGRPDFLYGAGSGLLVLNTPDGFVEAKDCGISYKPGKIGPVFGDFDNDGRLDLFVPQTGTCKLFRNDGKGHFTDVTAQAGDLANPIGRATSAAWGDFDNDGNLDLVVGCLRGPNRYFRNKGDGTFEDATTAVGLNQRIFNTQAVCLVDVNNDGVLDMVFNNEGQEPAVLLGNPSVVAKRTPVTVQVAGTAGVTGSRVRVFDTKGTLSGTREITSGADRGGQQTPTGRFALDPGTYRVEVRYSSGVTRAKEIAVAAAPLRVMIDEQTPRVD